MKNHRRFVYLWSLVVVGLVVGASAFAATYQGPTQPFPNANVTAPLDTGSGIQSRQGEIQLGDKINFSLDAGMGPRLYFSTGQTITAQGGVLFTPITISGTTVLTNPSNVFQLNTTGLVLPNRTTATASATKGNLIYNTDQNSLYFYNGSTWQAVGTGSGGGGGVVSTSSVWIVNGSNIYYRAGNVGIGYPSPRVKLDVVGHALITRSENYGDTVQTLSVGGMDDAPAVSGNSEDGAARFHAAGPVPHALDIGVMSTGNTNIGGYGWLQARSRIDYSVDYGLALNPNGGPVTIGTTAEPTYYNLRVYNPTANAHMAIETASANEVAMLDLKAGNNSNFLQIGFYGAGFEGVAGIAPNSAIWDAMAPGGSYIVNEANSFISFMTGGWQKGNERMHINAAGRIGIGTSTPVTQLQVYNATSGPILTLSGRNTNYRGVTVKSASGTEEWFSGANSGNNFVVRRAGSSDIMTLSRSTGYVGMGTSNPQAQLHLQGGGGSIGIRLGLDTNTTGANTPMLMWDATNRGANRVYWMRQENNNWAFMVTDPPHGWGNQMTLLSVDSSGNIFLKPDSRSGSVNIGASTGGYDSLVNLNVRGNLSLETRFGSQYVYSKGPRTNSGDPRSKVIAWNHTPALSDWATNQSGGATDWISGNRMSCDGNLNFDDNTSNCPSNDYPESGSSQSNKYDYFVGVEHPASVTCPFPASGLPLSSNPGNNCVYYTAARVFTRATSAGGDLFARNGTFSGNVNVAGSFGVGTETPQARLDVAGDLNFNGQKVCSGVKSGSWRDTILVPASWPTAACQSYASGIGAPKYQLGCMFSNSMSWGDANGSTPSPNCGWGTSTSYSFTLSQNYPNPFSASTKINYSIPSNGNVKLKVLNSSGGLVTTLVDETKSAGAYIATFTPPGSLASGVVEFRVEFNNFALTKKGSYVK